MSLLGGVLGGLLTFAMVLAGLFMRPAPARVLGALGWPVLLGLALWPTLVQGPDPSMPIDPLTIGSSNIFLILGLLAVLALSLGGLGLNALLGRGLPLAQRAAVTSGIAVGLLLSLLPALAAAELVGRPGRRKLGESPQPGLPGFIPEIRGVHL